jgi:CCR4-NOT transcriptional regulation complex NOT5 subunit
MKKIYIVIIIIGKNKKEEKMKNNKIKKLIKLRGKAKTWVGTVISFI